MILFLIIPIVIVWLFLGYFESMGDPESVETVFFIKKRPSFRIHFYNPKRISNETRKGLFDDFGVHEQAEYCRYRYGLFGSDDDIIIQCKKFEDLSENND